MDINTEHWTIDYYNPDGTAHYRPKKAFDDEYSAQGACFAINIKPHTIHKAVAYKCSECSKWHIGHHTKVLTEAEKEKIRIQLDKWRIVNKNKFNK